MFSRGAIRWGACLAALGVILGAFGAHGLEDRLVGFGYEADLGKRLDWFETAVKYHLIHAVGIVVAGLVIERREAGKLLLLAPPFLFAGIVLFSGSLYSMTALSDQFRWLGAITPLGGLSFIIGWLLLAAGSKGNS
jgi:uncharacterized membrane protein YgdD (TMEM256/DUF423 family)